MSSGRDNSSGGGGVEKSEIDDDNNLDSKSETNSDKSLEDEVPGPSSELELPSPPLRKKSKKQAPEPPVVQIDDSEPPEYEPPTPEITPPLPLEAPPPQEQQQTLDHYYPMEIYAAVVASFSFLCIGLQRSYTSPAIASMKVDHAFFNGGNPMSKTVISWVAASPPLASFFGTILSGLALQYCGRQKTLLLLTLPFIGGWLLIGLAKNTAMVMTGRALTGLGAGFATAAAQLYVSETVRAKVRGFLGILPAMMLSLGILLGFSLSTINLDWQEFALLMTCFPILLLLFAIPVPESPSWLLLRGKETQAIRSLKQLRGVEDQNKSSTNPKAESINSDILNELEEMKRVMKKHHKSRIEDGKEDEEPQDFVEFVFKDLLGKREIWFPAFVSLSLMVFQQFTGANAVIFYLSLILNEAAPETGLVSNSSFLTLGENDHPSGVTGGLNTNVSSVVVGLVQFFAFFLSLPLIDRLGRRALLIASAVLMIVPHLVLGIYFYVKLNPTSSLYVYKYVYKYQFLLDYTSSWLPLTCLCGFIAAYSIGFGPVPFIIMSEIFPSHARSYMCALASLVNHLTLFFIVRVFPTMIDWIGPHIIFWLFAVFCAMAAIHVAIVVPETKGKTLAEIELEFMHPDRRDSNCSSDLSKVVSKVEGKNKKKGKEGKNSKESPPCNCKHEKKKSKK